MGTKENLTKWADEQYKGSNQSYEKITRKPRTCLSKSEREDIAAFISQNRYIFLLTIFTFPINFHLGSFF
jgi:hypothetical protein